MILERDIYVEGFKLSIRLETLPSKPLRDGPYCVHVAPRQKMAGKIMVDERRRYAIGCDKSIKKR